MQKPPTSSECVALSRKLFSLERDLERHEESFPFANPLALLGGRPRDSRPTKERVAGQLGALLRADPAGKQLVKSQAFKDLQALLPRQAQLRKGPFADPCAPIRLADVVAVALATYADHVHGGTKPNPPGREDWRDAIQAVDTLIAFEQRGVWLSNAIKLDRSFMPFDWLKQLRSGLVNASGTAPKPHRDANITARHSVHQFTRSCAAAFGVAPPVMVMKFGELIGYEAQSLKRHIKEWKRESRTDFLL